MAKQKRDFSGHGNRLDNPKPHHLYEIVDSLEDDVFKYGISAKPIGKDGYSSRMREQVTLGNLFVGWARFFARILLRNIPGRERAEEIETEHIDAYEAKHGRKPRGNRK